MKVGIHSQELKRAINLAKTIVSLNWKMQITTNVLDILRMVRYGECDTVILNPSVSEHFNDFIVEAIKSIVPDYPIILFGMGLQRYRYRKEKHIYYMESPPDEVKLKEILKKIVLYVAENKEQIDRKGDGRCKFCRN